MTPSGAQGTGDMDPREFREHAHAVVDWIADYLAGVDELPVLPALEPGELRGALPAVPPVQGEPMERILRDFDELILPAVTHWNHPSFRGYFAVTG